MNPQTIENVSTGICIIGALPYIYRAYRREIDPQITSWALWSFIAFALLLTYKDAGDGASYGPAVVSFISPTAVFIILVFQRERWAKLELLDYACIGFGIAALATWAWMRTEKDLAQYALYLALVADACAGVRTIYFVWTNPSRDRPFAWIVFSLGMGVSILAVGEHSPANMAYAVYMTIGSLISATPLVVYRLWHRVPLREWI